MAQPETPAIYPVTIGRRRYEVVYPPGRRFAHVYRILADGARRSVKNREALAAVRVALEQEAEPT